jgi:predicted GH43/DUF377 family glycosyl hydrolase
MRKYLKIVLILFIISVFTTTSGSIQASDKDRIVDDFEDGLLSEYIVEGLRMTEEAISGSYSIANITDLEGYAWNPSLSLKENRAGMVSIDFKAQSDKAHTGVGFSTNEGERVYLRVDFTQNEINIKRRAGGYSIFDIIPEGDQKDYWDEEIDGNGFYIWEVEGSTVKEIEPGGKYRISLYFSRLSRCVFGILEDINSGSVIGTIRTIVDISPQHPFFIAGGGAILDNLCFQFPLDDWVYSWSLLPLRENPKPGESPSKPVLSPDENYPWQYPYSTVNPEVWREDGKFWMVYRSFNTENPEGVRYHGMAWSEDGVKWETDGVRIAYGEDPVIIHNPFGENKHYVIEPGNILKTQHRGLKFIMVGDEVPYGNAAKEAIDTEKYPQLKPVKYEGKEYRFIKFVEKYGTDHAGYVAFSNDLKHWVGPRDELLPPQPQGWSNLGRPIGGALVQPDGNIRVFYTACTDEGYVNGDEAGIASAVVDGEKPWIVIKESKIGLPLFPIYIGKKGGGNDDRPVEFDILHWDDGPHFPGSLVPIVEENKVYFYYGTNDQHTGLAVATVKFRKK